MAGNKVLEIGPYPPPGTGWSVRIKVLQKYLQGAGCECVVLNTGVNRKVPGPGYVCVQNGVDYVWKVFKYHALGFRAHGHVNGKSDKGPFLTIIALLVGALFFRRADLTFHAGVNQDYFPKTGRLKHDGQFWLIFKLARQIICNNEEVKEKIAEYGIAPEKVHPIPAFCLEYLEEMSDLPASVREFVTDKHPVLSTYVFCRPEFKVEQMVRTIRRVRDEHCQLGLVVMCTSGERAQIKEILNDHGLNGSALIASDLDHGEFLSVLARSDVFLRTPARDGVSSSVLEALHLGVPVVASEGPTRPEAVTQYGDDVECFVSKLMETLDNLETIKANLVAPRVPDTLSEEIALLQR